jgi:hypothetical protein
VQFGGRCYENCDCVQTLFAQYVESPDAKWIGNDYRMAQELNPGSDGRQHVTVKMVAVDFDVDESSNASFFSG